MAHLNERANNEGIRVAFIGSSHARRLYYNERNSYNLNSIRIHSTAEFSRGGLRALDLNNDSSLMDQAADWGADVAILVCGSNDLDVHLPSGVGHRIFARRIMENFQYLENKSITTFVIGIGERYNGRYQLRIDQGEYHKRSSTVNVALRQYLPVGRYINFRYRQPEFYCDGVHLFNHVYTKLLEDHIDTRLAEMFRFGEHVHYEYEYESDNEEDPGDPADYYDSDDDDDEEWDFNESIS